MLPDPVEKNIIRPNGDYRFGLPSANEASPRMDGPIWISILGSEYYKSHNNSSSILSNGEVWVWQYSKEIISQETCFMPNGKTVTNTFE